MHTDGYYHFEDDLEMFPDCVCYVCWSARSTGKTYSFLKYCLETNQPFIYMKRTNDDVQLICSYDPESSLLDKDPSPYAPINEDTGSNVRPVLIQKGFGAFYRCDSEDKPIGKPVGYILSLNKMKSIKGVSFSECRFLCFDEFIPLAGEIVRYTEGKMFLSIYMTVMRSNKFKGCPELKMVLFANAEEIATPVTSELEIIDDMADLEASGDKYLHIEDRALLLHHIRPGDYPAADENLKLGIAKLMKGTRWLKKELEGDFANNDFSNVKRKFNMKGFSPYIKLIYKDKPIYIYLNSDTGVYYWTRSRNDKCLFTYDLDKENDQKKFFYEHLRDQQIECMEGNVKFKYYSFYYLLQDYKKIFKL